MYTALSYAARGLPVEPQIHLDEGRTRQARSGKFVAANEENFERVLRSQAALSDDKLRRAEARLDKLRAITERVRRRFACSITVPAPPEASFAVSSRPLSLQLPPEFVAPPLALTNKRKVPAPPAQRYITSTIADWAGRLSAVQERLGKIANLRIVEPARASAAPPPRFETSAPIAPRFPGIRTAPSILTEGAPVPVPPMPQARTSGIPKPAARVAARIEPFARVREFPKAPARPFKVRKAFAGLRKMISFRAMAAGKKVVRRQGTDSEKVTFLISKNHPDHSSPE